MRINSSDILNLFFKRLLIALPFLVIGFLLTKNLNFFAPLPLVIAGIIMAGPFARLFSKPSGSIFHPDKRRNKPAPMYSIPEARIKQEKYEEAIDLYEEIIRENPSDTNAYIGMIKVSADDLGDLERARQLFRRGLSAMKYQGDRDHLSRVYKTVITGIKQ